MPGFVHEHVVGTRIEASTLQKIRCVNCLTHIKILLRVGVQGRSNSPAFKPGDT